MLEGMGFTIGELTPSVLLGICVLLMFLGRLVPRSSLQDKINEAEKWRLAYEIERTAHECADAQTTKLLELANITHNLVVSLAGSRSHETSAP
jgi:hypothetical protein